MKPIGSHSISESRILKKISVDNHVWHYSPSMEIGKRSIKDVSVFGGFCHKHDSIFYPIDNNDYTPGNREQEFLFFYRTFCRSFSNKTTLIKTYKQLIDFSEKDELGRINPYFDRVNISSIQKSWIVFCCNQEIKKEERILQNLKSLKNTIDHYYKVKRFDRVKSLVIEFDGEYGLAVGACSDIGMDFNGNSLPKDIPLSFTIFPQNNRTYTILSFLSKQSIYLDFLNTGLLNEREKWQKRLISYFIANSTDNWALSPAIWDKLSDKTKKEFEYHSKSKAKSLVIDCEEGLNLFVERLQ